MIGRGLRLPARRSFATPAHVTVEPASRSRAAFFSFAMRKSAPYPCRRGLTPWNRSTGLCAKRIVFASAHLCEPRRFADGAIHGYVFAVDCRPRGYGQLFAPPEVGRLSPAFLCARAAGLQSPSHIRNPKTPSITRAPTFHFRQKPFDAQTRAFRQPTPSPQSAIHRNPRLRH